MMLLTTQEAARELRLTKATLEAWRCRGGGHAFVKFGRAVRYRREDLDKFLISSLRSNTSNG